MRVLSRNDLEAIALRIWEAYKTLPVNEEKEIEYVNPDILLVNLLGLNIAYHHLSIAGNVLGATTRGDGVSTRIYDEPGKVQFFYFDGRTVLIERDLILEARLHTKCSFTKAHEAGHQILHMLYPKEYGEPGEPNQIHFYKERVSNSDWEEWQADTLGAAMLLPRELIEKTLKDFGLPDHIPMLNRVYCKDVYDLFCEMAKRMRVSKTTLVIRMQHLGIVDKEYIRNPYALIDID